MPRDSADAPRRTAGGHDRTSNLRAIHAHDHDHHVHDDLDRSTDHDEQYHHLDHELDGPLHDDEHHHQHHASADDDHDGSSGCDGTPAAATFASIDCRLDALLDDLNAEPGLGAFGPKLVKNVQTAKARKLDAEGFCRESNAKKVKKQLQQSAKALTQYAHRLNGLSARKKLASLRQRFLDEAAPIESDLKTLRGSVRCPDDAPAG